MEGKTVPYEDFQEVVDWYINLLKRYSDLLMKSREMELEIEHLRLLKTERNRP